MSGHEPSEPSVPPGTLPAVTPPGLADLGLDRLETMNAMMSINQRLGSLQTATEYLNRDIRDLKDGIKDLKDKDIAGLKASVDAQGTKISGIDKKIYAALAILAIAGAFLGPAVGFLLPKIFNSH